MTTRAQRIFTPPDAEEIVGICNFRGAILVATTCGVFRITDADSDENMIISRLSFTEIGEVAP